MLQSLRFNHKKLYLSAILDLYDRYPIALSGGRNDNRLVFKDLTKLLKKSAAHFTAIEGFNPIKTFKKAERYWI